MVFKKRFEKELPEVIEKWGWKYHHIGIPTDNIMPNERYLPQFKFYVSGFSESPFGIEWMRFDKDCKMHQLIQTVPHLAFVVANLAFELASRDLSVLTEPNVPMDGIRVVTVEHNGAPIELMEVKYN